MKFNICVNKNYEKAMRNKDATVKLIHDVIFILSQPNMVIVYIVDSYS